MKSLLIVVMTSILCFTISAQISPKNHLIHIGNEPFQIENSIQQNWKDIQNDASLLFEGDKIALLQFHSIPSTETKLLLKSKGIELLKYVPNFSWIARIKQSTTIETLIVNDVRNIAQIESDWKIPTELIEGNIPTYAGTINNIEVKVMFFASPINGSFSTILSKYGITPREVDNNINRVSLSASLSVIIDLAKHPLVQYIEFIEPPIQNETILEESERLMSTYISNNPAKNYYFNGSGANIAVDEGGTFDPLQNPNLRSRIDRNFEVAGTPSGHKTNVGMRMAKAGNIDPTEQGTAFGATLFSGGLDTQTAATNGINVVNRSYGWGCPSSTETYSGASNNYDFYVRTNPSFIISHSAGNDGSGTCYAGIPGWGNITGMAKMAKNIMNVGSSGDNGQLTGFSSTPLVIECEKLSGDNGQLTGFSSRGPSKDGRILPHIVAPGQGGTSYASPNMAGVFAQLIQAYRFHNNGNTPDAGLIKAIIMNSADDMLNPGPDFKTGFGHVNARRAYGVIHDGNHLEASITNGAINNHSISVPANIKELKVMVYWVDWEATAGISTRSLVNDLDIVLTDPNSTNFQPWVLNPTFNSAALNQLAVRATDTLNNNEQITITDPQAGVYQLNVKGTMVPQGPQTYFMTFEFVYDDITFTHPHGGEKFAPNETQRIRWDAVSNGQNFDISYSNNNGSSWTNIVTGITPNERFYDWYTPQDLTNDALIKITRGNIEGQSDTTFSISQQLENLVLAWSCNDSSLLVWDELPIADGYVIYRIVGDYMDSVNYTTNTSIVINGLSATETEYFSIAAYSNGITGRRIIAIERPPNDLNCNIDDAGISQIVSPGNYNIPSCMSSELTLKVNVRNWGINTIDTIPIGFQINGGNVILDTVFVTLQSTNAFEFTFAPSINLNSGNNTIKVWTDLNGDLIVSNDTLINTIFVFQSTTTGPNFTQNFDNFSNCSTDWDCELITCNLLEGWYNTPNGSGDDSDWRTHEGTTGSANTGPSADHTSGAGKYLYLEGSGPCNSSTAQLISPCLDLTGINNAQLSFWYHAYGTSIGELHVDALADGEFFEDIMSPIIGNQGDLWLNAVVDISQFSDQKVVIIIRGSNGASGWESDLAIDDINISTSPIAEYTVNSTKICQDDNVVLSNTTLHATDYEWNFAPNTVTYEAGTNSNSINPEVSFDTPGLYTIELIASNSIGDDTLVKTNHIYVFPEQPELSNNPYCEGDSIIVFANNFGANVDYYLNGNVVYSGTNSSYHFENAVESDEIYVVYNVNNTCQLYSDTILISIIEVETGVILSEDELSAVAIGAEYQWIDCLNDFTPITGETNSTFAPILEGEYAVEVTENGCTLRSDCIEFNTNQFFGYASDSVNCFPNPTKGGVILQFGAEKEFIEIKVYSILGQLLSKTNAQNKSKVEIELPHGSAVYMIHLETEDIERVFRIVKN